LFKVLWLLNENTPGRTQNDAENLKQYSRSQGPDKNKGFATAK